MTAIMSAARRQLAEVGPVNLSVRAVARDVGVVSSAVYRYVGSRDELLTLLITEAYDSLGEHTERAVTTTTRRAPVERWVAAATTIRSWALDHRHEYALLYGTPVPGYEAPPDTSIAGTRVSRALLGIVRDAWAAGDVDPPPGPHVKRSLAADLALLRRNVDLPVPDAVVVRTIAAWTQLFGLLTFELFGQTRRLVEHHAELFRSASEAMARQIGLRGGSQPAR